MLNQISIQGRLARDPEMRRTQSGKAVTSFSIACDRDIKNQQTGEKEVDFIDCTAWNATAELIQKYFRKGNMIVVTGRLQIRKYTDKNEQKRQQAEILVGSVYFCGGKEKAENGAPVASSGYPEQAPAVNFTPVTTDDDALPF